MLSCKTEIIYLYEKVGQIPKLPCSNFLKTILYKFSGFVFITMQDAIMFRVINNFFLLLLNTFNFQLILKLLFHFA